MNTQHSDVDSFAMAVDIVSKTAIAGDDPAELLHETSKFARSSIFRQSAASRALSASKKMQTAVARSSKRYRHVEQIPVGALTLPPVTLGETLTARRSARAFGSTAVPFASCAAIVQAAYGVTLPSPAENKPALRTVASAGALFPLELYVVARNVDGLARGIYHFDPLRATLGAIAGEPALEAVSRAMIMPELADSAAFLIVISAVFLRSRFKYGLRGYRFILFEAGHVAQNALLAAQATNVAACPLGAFYDYELDAVLGLDGVLESSLYLVAVGSAP